eukprot:Tbor_TRINITY_DN305_c0_g1::TRINITY_DN305_c0_g1_i1::g.15477::m.15477
MTNKDGKVLIADLPRMTAQDLSRFEIEGGVWGKQRAIRRKQVNFACGVAVCVTASGYYFSSFVRRNTILVNLATVPVFAMFGLVSGNSFGQAMYPNVACNKETTMMRRTWWAKECSKHWDMSQINESEWKAAFPAHSIPLSITK